MNFCSATVIGVNDTSVGLAFETALFGHKGKIAF